MNKPYIVCQSLLFPESHYSNTCLQNRWLKARYNRFISSRDDYVNKELLKRCWHLGIYYRNRLHPPLIKLTRQYRAQITASITTFPSNFRESVRANLIERKIKWERLLHGSAIGPEPGHLVIACDPSTGAEPTPRAEPAATSTWEAGKKPPGAGNYVLEESNSLGLYRHCVEKKTFFLSITTKAKNVRKLLGHSRSPSECDFRHWHLASSLHASSVADHLNTKVTCEDNTERGGI